MEYSLEERRRLNIERNQQFLLQLFASQRDTSANTFESPTHHARAGIIETGHSSAGSKRRRELDEDLVYHKELQRAIRQEKRDTAINKSLTYKYPERSLQIKQISEYLTLTELLRGDEFTTIVAYGPSGCGKSTTLSQLLHARLGDTRIVTVNCRLLSSMQDLLWTIQTSLTKHFTDVFRLKKLPVWKLGRTYSVIDLANFLRSVITWPIDDHDGTNVLPSHFYHIDSEDGLSSSDEEDNLMNQNKLNLDKKTNKPKKQKQQQQVLTLTPATTIFLFLDNISHIMDYEPVFAALADLSRISERRFQLFATMEVAPTNTSGMLPTNFVHFPAYSQEELRNIVSRRIVVEAKWPPINSEASAGATPIGVNLLHKRLQQLLLQSMETLSLASTSIDLLVSAVRSLWVLLYQESPYRSYRNYQKKCKNDPSLSSNEPSLLALLPSFSHILVKRIIQEMIRRNRFNFYLPPSSHSSATDMDYEDLRSMIIHFKSSTNQGLSKDSVALAVSKEDHLSSTTLISTSLATSTSSSTLLPLAEHIQSLPYHLRVLLVAAFLAGTRGKQQDALYDPSSQTFKRRRHTKTSSDVHDANNPTSNKSSAADMGTGVLQHQAHNNILQQNDNNLPNRELFTYERLSALYAHVLMYCPPVTTAENATPNAGIKNNNNNVSHTYYAKPMLQALITRLEMYGLLQAMPGVLPVYHPLRRLHCGYRANIARQVAMAAADNIGFPLESFIYNKFEFN